MRIIIANIWNIKERTSCTVQREANSQRTKPQAYISIRRNESLVKFIAPSNTSGAMYLRVPTCNYYKNDFYCINFLLPDNFIPFFLNLSIFKTV